MKLLFCLAAWAVGTVTGWSSDIAGREEKLGDGTRYLLIGSNAEPAPLLLLLQGNLDTVRKEPIYTAVARHLVPDGFLTVLVDAPAHGPDARPGEPAELAAWASRVGAGEDLLGPFLARVRAVVDELIRQHKADPARLFVAGTSRGGFLAFHVAAHDARYRAVGAISPVTDLNRLREFAACSRPDAAAALSVSHLAPRLSGRPVWISIGNHDERVGTDAAIATAQQLTAAAFASGATAAPVELLVHAVAGHRSTERDHELLAAWLRTQTKLAR